MDCDHITKVLGWTVDEKANLIPSGYGCTNCDITSDEVLSNGTFSEHLHEEFVEGCFACKIRTLQMTTGDANGSLVANGWTNKKWDGELKAYRDARAQGIQPASTKMKDIKKAVEASDKTGTAFVAS